MPRAASLQLFTAAAVEDGLGRSLLQTGRRARDSRSEYHLFTSLLRAVPTEGCRPGGAQSEPTRVIQARCRGTQQGSNCYLLYVSRSGIRGLKRSSLAAL
ncbi:hypothetical protein NDU88_007358 [Pleurodeles waltl]|uniref:Uncharacterized protein n=1 Tax=Pleurodeles waltl TaxID=8319 RepID=A0AAV7PP17_PLEWA|nr:hypothetical protein NDU88_007358 [Pleurodeles waltl]